MIKKRNIFKLLKKWYNKDMKKKKIEIWETLSNGEPNFLINMEKYSTNRKDIVEKKKYSNHWDNIKAVKKECLYKQRDNNYDF